MGPRRSLQRPDCYLFVSWSRWKTDSGFVTVSADSDAATTACRTRVNLVCDLLAEDQALFFEVTAEKADQRCSTLSLAQCGHAILSLSCSAMVKIFENVFLQPLQMNS